MQQPGTARDMPGFAVQERRVSKGVRRDVAVAIIIEESCAQPIELPLRAEWIDRHPSHHLFRVGLIVLMIIPIAEDAEIIIDVLQLIELDWSLYRRAELRGREARVVPRRIAHVAISPQILFPCDQWIADNAGGDRVFLQTWTPGERLLVLQVGVLDPQREVAVEVASDRAARANLIRRRDASGRVDIRGYADCEILGRKEKEVHVCARDIERILNVVARTRRL